MSSVCVKAPAKINLGLDVTGRRENGYHDVRMIMQGIELSDELILEERDDYEVSLSIRGEDGRVSSLSTTDNLICIAAGLVMDLKKCKGVNVTLTKNIPIAAGLAGGSTDAAATILGMNMLYELNLSMEEMEAVGVKIGADVPFCLHSGTMLSEGIGEVLTPLKTYEGVNVLIAKPPVSVSTKDVYNAFDSLANPVHPDIDRIRECVEIKDLTGMSENIGNILEGVTVTLYPVIEEIKEKMLSFGAIGTLMSGSGPTVFGLFSDEASCRKAAEEMRKVFPFKDIYVTKFANTISMRSWK